MTDAPTTRETAGHAELLASLRASKRDRHGIYGRVLVNPDGPRAAAVLETLLSEIAALRGERDRLKRHRDVLAITCQRRLDDWRIAQAQATQAERQRDEAIGLLRRIDRTYADMQDGNGNHPTELRKVRAFLANQGADQ